MNRETYSLVAGTVMIIAAFAFFMLPVVFPNIDAFIPVMMSIFSLMVGVGFFFMGHSGK